MQLWVSIQGCVLSALRFLSGFGAQTRNPTPDPKLQTIGTLGTKTSASKFDFGLGGLLGLRLVGIQGFGIRDFGV